MDIVLVQETHFRAGGSFKFAYNIFPTFFVSLDVCGKAGVANLIKESCPLRFKNTLIDPHGRYFALNCDYMSFSFTLINTYTPNTGQIQFINEVFERFHCFSQPHMIFGWYFTMVMSPNRDRRSLFYITPSQRVLSQASSLRKCVRT